MQMQHIAQQLVSALELALSVFEEKRRRMDASRERAEAMHMRLMNVLKGYRAGESASPFGDRKAQFLDTMKDLRAESNAQAVMSLSKRREEAFCDCYDALIRLYAYPQAQSGAEKVAALLRSIRLLEVSDEMLTPPNFASPESPGTTENETGEQRRQHWAGTALDFLGSMDGFREKVQHTYEEKHEQAVNLLRQAIDEARAIADASAVS